MKKAKFLCAALAFLLVATALPLYAGAEEVSAIPIKSGETVAGSPSSQFPETYTVTVANSGEMTINLETDESVNIEVLAETGKPMAPTNYTDSIMVGKDKTSYYVLATYRWEQGTFVYDVKPGTYTITLSARSYGKLCSTKITVALPLPAVATATTNRSTVLVDGEKVAFDAYTIEQNNYFKLRDLAKVLSGTDKEFEVEWNGEKNAISLTTGQTYTAVGGELAAGDGTDKTANLNTATIYLDGVPVQLTAYTINQNNYFKLRDVGQALGFDVSWNGLTNTIVVDTTKGYTPD